MAVWVKAINNYSIVTKKVEPKKKRYNEVKEVLNKAEKELAEKMAELQAVKDNVANLERKCEEM